MPNYQSVILDGFLQNVIINQEGELFVGGVGVFAGYLGRDDLTEKALIDIDGELFYRTGDLVRMDNNGLLHYQGRKDHQIKLHGQRIELGEIERCLLNKSISACVVIKWSDDHLVAYVQSSDVDEKQLREHCLSHLPPHMIPSIFIILDKLPLNANGKIDRKHLPIPQFSTITNTEPTESLPLTSLEEQLRGVFIEAFHIESPDIHMSFGQMGGTSLDAIRALWLIRQEVCTKIDAGLLFSNPSIRQLARVIEPLLIVHEDLSIIHVPLELKEDQHRPMPSLYIELLGILLLICQWLFPIWLAYQSDSFFTLLFVPTFHLLSYVVCQRLLFCPGEIVNETNKLFSHNYYRWWFLNSMWSTNNSYWLKHLMGTPFYNYYLRLCGAQIGRHTHIYTALIDAPWLLKVGESTFISEEVVLSTLSYQDQTYESHPIQIGSNCSINTRCVLYDGVIMEDHAYVEPMSAVTGHISASNEHRSVKDQSFSLSQTMYQFTCLFSLLLVHGILLLLAYFVYCCCLTLLLPLSISLALSWLIWILASVVTVLLLLKFVVGSISSGHYPLNSYYYLHKLWLRQLIISSFHHSFDFVSIYDVLSPLILRYLGAHIEDDVKIAEFRQILNFPSNLLNIEYGTTMFGGVKLAPFQMTRESLCYIDKIHVGSETNLGNWCTLMPGTQLSSKILVGSLTLVTRETVHGNVNGIFLGIPAREMPFKMSDNTPVVNDLSFSNTLYAPHLIFSSIILFINKCILITLYLSLPAIIAMFIHVIFICAAHHYLISFRKKRTQFTYSEVITRTGQFLNMLTIDLFTFVGPYLSGTQYLVFLFRALGARIGCDVILPDINCVTDPHLTTIGDHVRLNIGAHIQVKYLL
jgi:non-ribosomal peptide synthetase-like protein